MITNLPTNLGDITVANISWSFTHKMATKTSWHRCGSKLRHRHLMYSALQTVERFLEQVEQVIAPGAARRYYATADGSSTRGGSMSVRALVHNQHMAKL